MSLECPNLYAFIFLASNIYSFQRILLLCQATYSFLLISGIKVTVTPFILCLLTHVFCHGFSVEYLQLLQSYIDSTNITSIFILGC